MNSIARRTIQACAAGAGFLALAAFAQPDTTPPSPGTDRGSAEDAATPSRDPAKSVTVPEDAQGTTTRAVEEIIASWPAATRSAARAVMAKYGQPKEFNKDSLVWLDNSPWKKTTVYRTPSSSSGGAAEETTTASPENSTVASSSESAMGGEQASAGGMTGRDYLEQTISYRVPADKLADISSFDPNVKVDAVRGEISSRAETEGQNFLALNLADEIVNGKRTASDAKAFFDKTAHLTSAGKSSDYMKGFMFPVHNAESVSP